jgi:hypothetical protein
MPNPRGGTTKSTLFVKAAKFDEGGTMDREPVVLDFKIG